MLRKFTLYPIWQLAGGADDESFDRTKLPFDVVEGIAIEDVSQGMGVDTFDHLKVMLGADIVQKLERVQVALVHRYDPTSTIENGQFVSDVDHSKRSEQLVRQVAACLRLVRPMRQDALLMHGNVIENDASLDVMGSDIPPIHLIEVPEVQKLFHLRNSDCNALKAVAPAFVQAMRGDYWKFRMSVQFHELGHFQCLDWKARYLLWCSAIESIYTTHNREHQGKRVATSRIKWFLGEHTSIYSPGDLSELLTDPHITVGQVVSDLYDVRNYLAHGDRIPDPFFQEVLRYGFNGGVVKCEVLLEAASFIVRSSLLKILRDGLIDRFTDPAAAEAFFGPSLTNSALRAAGVP